MKLTIVETLESLNTEPNIIIKLERSMLNSNYTDLEVQPAPLLTCTGTIKPHSSTPQFQIHWKHGIPTFKRQTAKSKPNPPIYSGIRVLRKNIEVITPRRVAFELLSDQKQSHRHPGLQVATHTPNLGGRHSIWVDPQPLGDLQNDLVPSEVSLGNEAQAFLDQSGPGRSLGGHNAFVAQPLPEGLDVGRQRGWVNVGARFVKWGNGHRERPWLSFWMG